VRPRRWWCPRVSPPTRGRVLAGWGAAAAVAARASRVHTPAPLALLARRPRGCGGAAPALSRVAHPTRVARAQQWALAPLVHMPQWAEGCPTYRTPPICRCPLHSAARPPPPHGRTSTARVRGQSRSRRWGTDGPVTAAIRRQRWPPWRRDGHAAAPICRVGAALLSALACVVTRRAAAPRVTGAPVAGSGDMLAAASVRPAAAPRDAWLWRRGGRVGAALGGQPPARVPVPRIVRRRPPPAGHGRDAARYGGYARRARAAAAVDPPAGHREQAAFFPVPPGVRMDALDDAGGRRDRRHGRCARPGRLHLAPGNPCGGGLPPQGSDSGDAHAWRAVAAVASASGRRRVVPAGRRGRTGAAPADRVGGRAALAAPVGADAGHGGGRLQRTAGCLLTGVCCAHVYARRRGGGCAHCGRAGGLCCRWQWGRTRGHRRRLCRRVAPPGAL